jgi:hypothetical protein
MNCIQPHPTMPNYRKLLTPEEFREIVAKGESALIAALSKYVRETGGRKKTGAALSGAERVRLYRQRKREEKERAEIARIKGERAPARKGGASGKGRGKT